MNQSMKLVALVVIVGLVGLAAYAGFDLYNSKNYTVLMAPQLVQQAPVTNSVVTGVDCIGLPGNGCLVLSYVANNMAAASVSFGLSSCATTNGSYVPVTNSAGVSTWAYTNAAGFATVLFKPNTVSRYLRVTVTPSATTTNGVAGAVLVTE